MWSKPVVRGPIHFMEAGVHRAGESRRARILTCCQGHAASDVTSFHWALVPEGATPSQQC